MNKQFSFRIKVNGSFGTYSFTAPLAMGGVITNAFCPNSLFVGEDNLLAQIATPQNGEAEYEFVNDCNSIVNYANAASGYDIADRLEAGLKEVVRQHIQRCGRLLFQDLLLYVDCFAYLLKAVGYSNDQITKRYCQVTRRIVDNNSRYVKESHTLVDFTSTNLYNILCRLA